MISASRSRSPSKGAGVSLCACAGRTRHSRTEPMVRSFFTLFAKIPYRTYAPAWRSPQGTCSPCPVQQRHRRGDDLGQAFGRAARAELGRFDPTRIIEFSIENRLARNPARGKTQNDEVPFDMSLRVAGYDLAMPGKRN